MCRAIEGGVLAGNGQRLVVAVDVERLRAAEDGRQRLDGAAGDVEVGEAGGGRHPGRLHVEPELLRRRVGDAEFVPHEGGPHPPGGPELGDLLEEVGVGVEEERDLRQRRFRRQAPAEQLPGGGPTMRQRERQLQRRVGARLPVVVPGDADGVPPGQLPDAELGHVALHPERRRRRQRLGGDGDGRLHEKVVLAGAGQRRPVEAPPLRRGQEHGQMGSGPHRLRRHQRHAHRIERNAGEEIVEVVGNVDGHAAPPDVRRRPGVVGPHRPQARVVEHAVDPGGAPVEEQPVAPVGVGGGGEAGQLAESSTVGCGTSRGGCPG